MNAIVHDFSAAAQPLGREQRALEARATTPVTLAATLRGPLDVPRLRDALLRVAARHPSLGLAFGHAEGLRGLRQRFEGVPPQWAEAADAIAAPADPADPLPALRATLLPLGPDHHQLLLAASPLAADGASLVTLYRELARAYAGEDANAAEDPQEAPLAYADYLEWTAGLAQDNAQAGHDYWHGIAGALAALDAPRLPWRRAAPDAAPAPAELNARIGSDEAAALQAWAQALGQPLPLALQAAWWLLLWRLDPADAFAAGWLHDCRRDFDALAGAVGRYEAVLPLAVRPDPDAPFAHWLAQLAAQAGSHLDWREHCPADAAAGAPGRIGFALATLPPAMPARGGPHWQAQPPQALPGFELALEIREDEHGAPRQFALHYDGARYRADAMSCLLDQYHTLLDTLRARPGTAIGALPLATAADAARAAAMHAAPLDAGTRMLPQRLAQWGRERPHQNALSAAGLQLDYRALNQRVDALAARLPALGLRRGAPVGLLLPRGGELVLALLAVLRAGGAYLPLDPSWPAPRRARILADAGATLVLAGARHLPGGADDTDNTDGAADLPPHVDVAALLADSATAPADAGEPDIAAGQPAYVLYTSGSTGTPKGVVIEHGQLLNYAAAAGHALGLDRCERFALTSTVAADLGNTTLFGALWHGACLCVADDADTQDAAAFARFLARERPDCLKMVPSHLDALLGDSEGDSEHDNDGNGASAPLPAGAAIVLGGESASPALLARLRRRAPAARLCNHYGPTETTVGILVHADDADDADDASDAANDPGAGLPLTTVLANCEAHVLNAAGELAAAGETGELYLGGAQLCRGYLGRDSDAFVPHPRRAGERLYRSGDLARYLPRGGLELAGRADGQLKVRGFRIECGEIEHALLALPGVRQAAVVPMAGPDGATGETRLAAWLVPDDDSAVPLGGARRAALRAALAARLPEPMVPAHWTAVAELPRLPNGKVDRRALATRALPGDDAPAGAIAREPADALEALLLEQMRELLDAPALRVTDDLFEAGGHSLLVIKLVARIRKLLKLEIAPGAVFDAPSAAALATALRAASADPAQLETLAGLQRTLAAMSPEARAALRASAGAPAATAG